MDRLGSPDEVVALAGVAKRFIAGVPGCSAAVQALAGVSLTVRRREAVAVAGPAGSGKSTLALCAAGLLRLDHGTVRWGGRNDVAVPGAAAVTYIDARVIAGGGIIPDYRGGLLIIDSVDPGLGADVCLRLRHMMGQAIEGGALLITGRSGEVCRWFAAPARLSATYLLMAGRLIGNDTRAQAWSSGRVAERPEPIAIPHGITSCEIDRFPGPP